MPINGLIGDEPEGESTVIDADCDNGKLPCQEVSCGTPGEQEHDLPAGIGDVKAEDDEQQTALHEAVRLSDVESLTILLAMGVDPLFVMPGCELTALEWAEEMVERHPDEADRKKILTWLRLVEKFDAPKKLDGGKGEDFNSALANHLDRKTESLESSTLQEVLSTVSKLSQDVASLTRSVERLSQEVKAEQDVISERITLEVSKLRETLVGHLTQEVVWQKEALLKHFDAELESQTESLTEHVSHEASTIQDSVLELVRQELTRQRKDLWEQVEKEMVSQENSMLEMIHKGAMTLQESAVDNLATEVMSQLDTLSDQVRDEFRTLKDALLKSVADRMSSHEKAVSKVVTEEGDSLRDLFKDTREEARTYEEEFSETLREAVDDVKTALNSRERVLEKLEVSVVSLVEGWRPFKHLTNRSFGKTVENGKAIRDDGLRYVITCSERAIREDCIEALMSRTEFWRRSEENVSHVRGLYEKIFSLGDYASCPLRFLHFHPDVQIVVDCESTNIGSMKRRLRDMAGRDCEGRYKYSFADCKSRVLYLGGKVDSNWKAERVVCNLVMTMLQMAAYLAFDNGGRPYSVEDEGRAELYKRAIDEAKEAWSVEDSNFDYFVSTWVSSEVAFEREACMISAIPGMISYYALPDGLLKARRRMRSLTRYYEDHVMPRLMKESGFTLSP